ncbi:hypothetical protein SDC9_03517 [bioreactor metagenome]|uniref:HTH marR-type domain-containing protein n=1 Tax=bioreactor metagenome TaxID=1076179 RepID=A0A644SWD0_9ZZZZ|nr:winged helix-turn-helix transcriptional regulator [Methanobrevibacter sp.]MEA4956136.1 winged helix-turn-helix transcriptional regulator [Methanobrevibacter sp.]
MMVSLVKEQKGNEFIQEMEKTYKSLEEAEKLLKRTPRNMILYVDIENWKYYKKHPDETIKRTTSIVTKKLTLGELEIELLNTIKRDKPKSIRELAKIVNKDISSVQPKVKNLEQEGLIELKEGNKNSKIPYLNYDEITLAI